MFLMVTDVSKPMQVSSSDDVCSRFVVWNKNNVKISIHVFIEFGAFIFLINKTGTLKKSVLYLCFN